MGGIALGLGISPYFQRRGASFVIPEITAYINRVVSDGGTVVSESDANKVVRWLKQHGLLDSTELLYLSTAGLSIRDAAGNLQFVEKVYSLDQNLTPNDGTQSVELNQPRLVGGIAPRSKVAAANLNDEMRYFTHPEISFGANEAWSVSYLINWDYDIVGFLNWITGGANRIYLRAAIAAPIVAYTNSLNTEYRFTNLSSNSFIGKYNLLTITADGAGNTTVYLNGTAIQTLSAVTSISFNTLSYLSTNIKITSYLIQSTALTPTQVASLHTTLRGLYPEIESVDIGTQTWATRNFEAVATPKGNKIANVTENGAVEKIVQPLNFTTNNWFIATDNAIINNATQFTTISNSGIRKAGVFTVGKWHKVTINGNTTASTFSVINVYGGALIPLIINNFGTTYYKATSADIYLRNEGAGVTNVTEFSIQELNWSNATEIYDAVYAATSGTAAEKEYAALKESAMWCYYNNSADNGAIYGKLYNWYAAKLLDLDMASSGFGWRIPTSTDFNTLATELGGASVAGGKMKMTGENYWNTPNTGATNESGFTALAGGVRIDTDGNFILHSNYCYMWTLDTYYVTLINNSTGISFLNLLTRKGLGYALRLIKDE